MITRIDPDLQIRLKQAEQAETTVQRLNSLAAEAPTLRMELARAQRQQTWDRSRRNALEQAEQRMSNACHRQENVPQMLNEIYNLVAALYKQFKDIDSQRHAAFEYMSEVDQVDHEEELTKAQAEQIALGRDGSSVEYVVAAHHGPSRVRHLMEEHYPDFNFLKDCDLEGTMRRDIARFVLSHVLPPEEVSAMISRIRDE